MQLGFLTGSADDITKAARIGFDGIEINTRAFGRAADGPLDADRVARAKADADRHGVTISALAHYGLAGGTLEPAPILASFNHVFDAAEALGVRVIAAMSGFDADRNWDENVQMFADRFGPVADAAEQRGMKIAFENWMGYGGHLPFRPSNMGGSPHTWDAWFSAVPSPALGIEFDPSHLAWQGIDHMRALLEYKDRVHHVHAKDVENLPELRYRIGANGNAFRFRIPGYGEINWAEFVGGLVEIGYDGGVAIEHEDDVFGQFSPGEKYDDGLVRGWQHLEPLIHPRGRS